MTTLGEYIKVQGGYAYKSKDFIESSDNKVIKIKNVRFGTIDYSEPAYVSNEIAEATKNWKVKEGDVLISMTGSGPNAPQSLVGRVARVWKNEPDAWINQRVGRVCLLDEAPVYLDFIFYWLSLPQSQDYLVSNSSGSANQANISGKIIESLPCPKVDYQISKQIADLARKFDEKIILNSQTNQTLEEMAQAIFKSWFVDFDPVKAKMNGELPEGMDAATASLFPEKLVDTEVGELPEGWKLVPVGELLDKTIGGDWGKEEPDDKHTEVVRIVRGTDIPKLHGGAIASVPVRYVESKKLKTRKLERGDIVIEVSGGSKDQPTGRSLFISDNILKRLELPSEPASFCRRFKPKNYETGLLLTVHFQLMYQAGKTWEYQNQSTGISNFQTKYFLEAEHIVIPSDDVLDAFVKQVSPMMDMIHSNQNIELANLRDTLLPKLLSGEINLDTTEELVEVN